MIYMMGLAALALVIFGIVKAITKKSYTEMTEEEFEAEAKRSSHLGSAVAAAQRIVDPSHRVEHVQEQQARNEAESDQSGDRPPSRPGS